LTLERAVTETFLGFRVFEFYLLSLD